MAPTVILIGFMGAGKSTVGKQLAKGLGWDFIDSDKESEKELGMKIPKAFKELGESGFRKAEETVIARLLTDSTGMNKGRVISLGGGAVTIKNVRELLKKEQLVFFLNLDVDAAYNRVCETSRPLAADQEKFRTLYLKRAPLYREAARYIVETGGMKTAEVADEIVRLLGKGGQ